MQFDVLPGDDPAALAEREERRKDLQRQAAREEARAQARAQAEKEDKASEADPNTGPARLFGASLLKEFENHTARLRVRSHDRREAVLLKSVINDKEARESASAQDLLGRWQPQDEFQGDVNLRTLRTLLKMIDENGFERSPHQVR